MKSKTDWGFSVPASAVDFTRILREAGVDREAVRITLNGEVFTVASRVLAERRKIDKQSMGALSVDTKVALFGKDLVWQNLEPGSRGMYLDGPRDVLIFKGDRVAELVSLVVAKVEVF